ncbi:ABC transporter permease subunit [Bosea sp. (in: a-proteobacteria)]|uniref:ABC transporter permease subunit n=1 Tax=Bosea sp. (in: a-proteobacteria) TaxID=1871050 RepID=UPI001ACA9D59|nr:ABC transporter permease subunit [Bosea sp. (in: a-proteobacteria)]MBN9441890.1 ABC transporter permease subunit [Bosea sp. (in: a-proteobacteria)]
MIESVVPYLPALTNGLLLTLFYFALGALGSMLLALPVALAMGSASLFVRYPTIAYVEFFRNTPLLVQLFWMHFALPAVTGLNTTAHQTAGHRDGAAGGKHGGPCEQLLQAFPIALPAIGNTLVSLLKATAILSILSVPELMRTTSRISDYTANPITFYSLSAVIYIALCLALSYSLHRLETRLSRWRVN